MEKFRPGKSILEGEAGRDRPKIQKNPMRPYARILLCVSAGAVVGWQSEFRVCSSSALVWSEIGKHVFRASPVPA